MIRNSAIRNPNSAFTLVELLVVITIIVVLLSLLAPALSKAVYQAQLAQCGGGNLKVMSTGVTAYAMENKRYYPDRDLAGRTHNDANPLPVNPQTISRASVGYDMRDIHKKVFPINKTVQCPMSPAVELENEDATSGSENLDASYTMWWGWQYKHPSKTFAGMFKMGSRFEYEDLLNDPNRVISFNVLAGDIDLEWNNGPQASHPDRNPALMYPIAVEGEFFIDGRSNVGRWTSAPGIARGLLDTNYVFADLSVARYNDVTRVILPGDHPSRHPALARLPINFNNFNNRNGGIADKLHLPTR